MPPVLLYKCDNKECDRLSPPYEQKYWGKFPRGWIRTNIHHHPEVDQSSAGNKAYCSLACFRQSLESDDWDHLATLYDTTEDDDDG